MQLPRKFKLSLFLVFSFFSLVAQTLPSKNITINDGLPSNSIKCFFKDSRGVMWIGTEAGLCAYDGTSFKIYNESNGLKHSQIWAIAEDNNKNLWLSIYGQGLAKFDGKKFTYFDKKDGLINNSIRKIYFSKKHNCLILGTENGLSLFDGKKFKSFVLKTSLNRFQVVGISEINNKIYFTVSYDNVYSIDLNNKLEKSDIRKEFTPTPSYSSFMRNDKFYGGIQEFNIKSLKTGNEKKYKCPIIWDYTIDNDGYVYCATWDVNKPVGGLYKWNKNELLDVTKKYNVTSNSLWCLYFDKVSNFLWIGSIDKGLYIIDLNEKVQFLNPDYFKTNELDVQCLFKDSKNNIWIGAKDKILISQPNATQIILDRDFLWKRIKRFHFSEIKQNKDIKGICDFFESKNTFSCFNITEDKEGNIWLATTDGFFGLNKSFEVLYHHFSDGGHIVFSQKDELIYSAMYAYTFLKYPKFNSGEGIVYSLKDENTPRDIIKILKHKGIVWFATNAGLYNFSNGQFTSLNIKNQFLEKTINSLSVDEDNHLIIGTNSGKVYISDWQNNKLKILKVYYPNKDLIGTSISFVEQINGVYFIGTNKGINLLKSDKFVKLINKQEGLEDLQFNDCIKDSNSNLLIATNTGIIEIQTKKCIKKENYTYPIVLKSIRINAKDFDNRIEDWTNKNGEILIYNYKQNNLEIQFNTNNLYNSEKSRFRYKIIGLSEIWTEVQNNQKIELLGVPSGKYIILIEGRNIGTGIVYEPLKIKFIINPPFWKTLWFIILISLMFVACGVILFKIRISKIRKEGQVKKRLAETKMEALQSQMNPHFIFNAMNSIQNYIIDNETNEALMYLGEFSKLIRQTLNNSSKTRITLADEIDYLESYVKLEKMRFKDSIKFVINVDYEIDTNEIFIPPMILQPLVENIFIHALDSKTLNPTIEISFESINNILVCTIKDNGKGFIIDNVKDTSKGIKLIKERLNLIQDSVEDNIIINSVPGEGTLLTIIFKLNV